MRLRGLIRKETFQIVRDPSSILIGFVLPVVLLLLFGYGVSLDAKHAPIALLIENPTAETSSFAASMADSEYFAPILVPRPVAAERALTDHRADAIVVLRSDFTRR
jgi:ABC-2 type transport system permease protein